MLECFQPAERLTELLDAGYAQKLARWLAIANGQVPDLAEAQEPHPMDDQTEQPTVAARVPAPRKGPLATVAVYGRLVRFSHTVFALPFG